MIRKVQQSEHRAAQLRYLARVGQIFLDASPEVVERFIITRRNRAGRNLHAAAMARMKRATPQQLAEWGRRGGEVSQRKRLSAAATATSKPGVASANESAAASALESE
jgi:hypothetical protein